MIILLYYFIFFFDFVWCVDYYKDEIDWDVGYFSRILKGHGVEDAISIVQDIHGYCICGRTRHQSDLSSEDILLLKTDEFGTPSWNVIIHQETDYDSSCMDVTEIYEDAFGLTRHGITGYVNSGEPSLRDKNMFVMEVSVLSSFESGWRKQYEDSNGKPTEGVRISTTDHGKIVISGRTLEDSENDLYSLYIASFLGDGSEDYKKVFDVNMVGHHFDMSRTKYSIFLTGTLLDEDKKKVFVIKFNSTSSKILAASIIESSENTNLTARSVFAFEEDKSRKNILLVSEIENNNSSFVLSELQKKDLSLVDSRIIDLRGEDENNDIIEIKGLSKIYYLQEGGYLLGFNIRKKPFEDRTRLALLKLGSDHDVEWIKYYDQEDYEHEYFDEDLDDQNLSFLARDDDDGYVAVGTVKPYHDRVNNEVSRIFISKIDAEGQSCFLNSDLDYEGWTVDEFSLVVNNSIHSIHEAEYSELSEVLDAHEFNEVLSVSGFHAYHHDHDLCVQCEPPENEDETCYLVPDPTVHFDDDEEDEDDSSVDNSNFFSDGGWSVFAFGIPLFMVCCCCVITCLIFCLSIPGICFAVFIYFVKRKKIKKMKGREYYVGMKNEIFEDDDGEMEETEQPRREQQEQNKNNVTSTTNNNQYYISSEDYDDDDLY